MKKKEKLSFVVPCYRSEKTITKVVDDINKLMKNHKDFSYEIILVNDSSPDNVWSVIEKLIKKQDNIIGINLAKNFGQHSALMAGYNYCTGDYVVTLDDDGQTPVEETFKLINKLFEGYDVVYGKYIERKDNGFRKFGTKMNNLMSKVLLGKPKNISLTSFFVAKSYIIKEICTYKNAFPYIWGLVLRTTKNIVNVDIKHSERLEGKSGYTLGKLINLWLNGFTAFSIKPLRIAFGVGVLFTILGIIGTIFVVINKILHPEIAAGFTSLMCVLLIIGGFLMLSNGLIGEYIGRIYICINSTPQFVVKEVKGKINE